MSDVNNFEIWLRKVCFQKPTKEAYDLAKDAWNEAGTSLRAENERLKAENINLREVIEKALCSPPTEKIHAMMKAALKVEVK